jgi:hypothetical protein
MLGGSNIVLDPDQAVLTTRLLGFLHLPNCIYLKLGCAVFELHAIALDEGKEAYSLVDI